MGIYRRGIEIFEAVGDVEGSTNSRCLNASRQRQAPRSHAVFAWRHSLLERTHPSRLVKAFSLAAARSALAPSGAEQAIRFASPRGRSEQDPSLH
jgi:hypothetical protein